MDQSDNALKLRATQSMSEDYLKERLLNMGEGIVGQVAVTRKPRSVLNLLEEPDYEKKELAQKEGIVSITHHIRFNCEHPCQRASRKSEYRAS